MRASFLQLTFKVFFLFLLFHLSGGPSGKCLSLWFRCFSLLWYCLDFFCKIYWLKLRKICTTTFTTSFRELSRGIGFWWSFFIILFWDFYFQRLLVAVQVIPPVGLGLSLEVLFPRRVILTPPILNWVKSVTLITVQIFFSCFLFFFGFLSFEGICYSLGHFAPQIRIGLALEGICWSASQVDMSVIVIYQHIIAPTTSLQCANPFDNKAYCKVLSSFSALLPC